MTQGFSRITIYTKVRALRVIFQGNSSFRVSNKTFNRLHLKTKKMKAMHGTTSSINNQKSNIKQRTCLQTMIVMMMGSKSKIQLNKIHSIAHINHLHQILMVSTFLTIKISVLILSNNSCLHNKLQALEVTY